MEEGKRSVNLAAGRKPRKEVKQSVSPAEESRARADAAEDANLAVNFILYLTIKLNLRKLNILYITSALFHIFIKFPEINLIVFRNN